MLFIGALILGTLLTGAASRPPSYPTFGGEQIFIKNNDVTIHYCKYGSGPYLIFQHGFPDRETTWNDFQVSEFSKNYTVLTPTLRGFPPSSIPHDVQAYTAGAYVSDVLAILAHEHISNITFIGHDFGGAVAQQLAFNHPDRVNALVILNTPIIPVFLPLLEHDAEAQNYARYTLSYYTYEPGQPKNVSTLVENIRNTTYRAEIAEYLEDSPINGMLNFYKNNYPGPPYGRNLSADEMVQKVPSMLLWGQEEPYISPKVLDGLEKWFENGLRLVTIPHAGHWVFRDQWRRANEEIWSFLGIAGRL
ncbi:putative hydrolase [Polyplosphaeria fusca]|uniref:Hydrolase n=1 Tax=Polyplosphaeria fusca TaxID=682080 RepID=A0A9P4QM08_9PLEO|nr:putative hydrolase [Polyplosphaeria fusca]